MTANFDSIDNCHSINIKLIGDTAYFAITSYDPEQIKTFLLLLKKTVDYMSKNNIKYVKQQINKDDIPSFTKSSFIQNENIVFVKTYIEDFISEICNALGIIGL